MATLKEALHADLTSAMRARDELTIATLRMALTAVTNAEVAGKVSRELSDDEVLTVVGKEAKKRRESAEAFTAAGRTELADREVAEGAVLARYLPQPLTDADLASLVDAAVSELGASGPAAFGSVMKAVLPVVNGRADGRKVSDAVRSALTN